MDDERLRALVDPAQAAVLTMELQRGVVEPGGVLPELAEAARADGLAGRVGTLCAAARAAGVHVVHCTAEFRPDGQGMAVNNRVMAVAARVRREHGVGATDIGTPGVELVPELGQQEGDFVVPRMGGVTPFPGTHLDQLLRNLGVRTVIATGVSLNLGVTGMVLSAADLGYQVVVPRDAVLGLPPEYGRAVIENSLSYVATIVTIDDLVRAWKDG
jgi:nicotinamidase-related amidase